MDWYYAESGRQVGPVQQDALEALARSGAIQPGTLVWHEGMANWQPYSTAGPATAAVPVSTLGTTPVLGTTPGTEPPTRFCTECGRPFSETELARFGDALVCANCKPIFAQKLREGVGVTGAVRYAGFWIRFVAALIDGAIMFLVSVMVGILATTLAPTGVARGGLSAFQGLTYLLNLSIACAYSAYFLVNYAATPGKMALRLKVITASGSPITLGLAIGRFFAHYLSALTLAIGYIMAAFDDQKRALHDRICETRVIHA